MNDTFEIRLRAAVRAGWWTVLIWFVVLTGAWFAWQGMLRCHGEWVLRMVGGDEMTMATLRPVILGAFATAKEIAWVWTMVVVFLTIWHRQIRRAG